MNTTRNIKATITRTVVVLDLDLPAYPEAKRAVLIDGVFRKHGEIIELDSGDGLSLIHSKRARRATPEEAAGDVIIARTHSTGSITSNEWEDEA